MVTTDSVSWFVRGWITTPRTPFHWRFPMLSYRPTLGGFRPLKGALAAGVAALLLVFSGAFAQSSLPENAAQAIARGQALMDEALATYDAQFPDRPLWQEAF